MRGTRIDIGSTVGSEYGGKYLPSGPPLTIWIQREFRNAPYVGIKSKWHLYAGNTPERQIALVCGSGIWHMMLHKIAESIEPPDDERCKSCVRIMTSGTK